MKQFIVIGGILPILMMLLMQVGIDQKNSQITSIIQAVVYSAKEEAKQEGIFTEKNKNSIVKNISELTGIDRQKIKVYADNKRKYRYAEEKNRLIHYKVVVEINNIVAASKLYGISKENNKYFYTIDSFTASEKI